jgi:hypothetical protein
MNPFCHVSSTHYFRANLILTSLDLIWLCLRYERFWSGLNIFRQLCHEPWVLLMSSQNTLPLSEPMFAGITQHWGRSNEYSSAHISIYFMFSLFIIMFTIVTCTIEFILHRSDLLDLILSCLSLSTSMP